MVTIGGLDKMLKDYREWFAREYYVGSGNLFPIELTDDEKSQMSYDDAMGRAAAAELGG